MGESRIRMDDTGRPILLVPASPHLLSKTPEQLGNFVAIPVTLCTLGKGRYDLIAFGNGSEARYARLTREQLGRAVRAYLENDIKTSIYVAPSGGKLR